MKRIPIYSELAYIVAILLLSFAVSLLTAADFGVSMVVAPSYIISQKLTFLTMGQCEYMLQGILFCFTCLLLGKLKPIYFMSFVTGLIYATVLDFWRRVIPFVNPNVVVPGSQSMFTRIVLFVLGIMLTAAAVALFFHTYLYPHVYDFFVKAVSSRFGVSRNRFKILFDCCCLLISCMLTLLLLGRFVGVGPGTLIMTACNGLLIGVFGRIYDRIFQFTPIFSGFAALFALPLPRRKEGALK